MPEFFKILNRKPLQIGKIKGSEGLHSDDEERGDNYHNLSNFFSQNALIDFFFANCYVKKIHYCYRF